MHKLLTTHVLAALLCTQVALADQSKIVHDAEYYVLEAQNGQKWAAEDSQLNAKLAELRKKRGTPPNIVHIMWDDTAFGDVGIPAIQKVRGFGRARARPPMRRSVSMKTCSPTIRTSWTVRSLQKDGSRFWRAPKDIHEADLFTTFARLAGATDGVPGDRIIDGIDQTALLINGDTHSHRDHVFIYAGLGERQ